MALCYNSVEFLYPLTRVNVMGPGKDPSGSDQLYTTVRLECEGVINTDGVHSTVFKSNGSVSSVLVAIRHYLTAPRRALYYDVASAPFARDSANAILNITDTPGTALGSGGGRDDANGPWPDESAFKVTYTTEKTFLVSWAVVVKLRDCTLTGQFQDGGLLSLRWDQSISWDKYFKAVFEWRGTAIFSSLATVSIDAFRRNKIAPEVPFGFAREKSYYTISRDGLRCDFAFTDVQLRYAPPPGVVDMDIRQNESGPTIGGMRKGEIVVNLTGVQNADPRDLAAWAITIGTNRLYAAKPLEGGIANAKAVIGQFILSTNETTQTVGASVAISYKIPPKDTPTVPSTLVKVGKFIGKSTAAIFSFGLSELGSALFGGTPEPPKTIAPGPLGGLTPAGSSVFPWIGAGTTYKRTAPPGAPPGTPVEAGPPGGFMIWADPIGTVEMPADGLDFAQSLTLFAAVLRDPCGNYVSPSPYADPGTNTELTTDGPPLPLSGPGTGDFGTGGDFDNELNGRPESVQHVAMSVSGLNADQYPAPDEVTEPIGAFAWDGANAVFSHWQCQTQYINPQGVIVSPTCNPLGVNIAIKHSSNTMTIRCRWAMKREGAPPRPPPSDLDDPNLILTKNYAAVREMNVNADEVSGVYEAEGVYEWQVLDVSKVDRTAAIPPFLNLANMAPLADWFDAQDAAANVVQAGGPVPNYFAVNQQSATANPLGNGQLNGNPPA